MYRTLYHIRISSFAFSFAIIQQAGKLALVTGSVNPHNEQHNELTNKLRMRQLDARTQVICEGLQNIASNSCICIPLASLSNRFGLW